MLFQSLRKAQVLEVLGSDSNMDRLWCVFSNHLLVCKLFDKLYAYLTIFILKYILEGTDTSVVEKPSNCLWVRIRGKANSADIQVGVCYRPPNQDEEADQVFCK